MQRHEVAFQKYLNTFYFKRDNQLGTLPANLSKVAVLQAVKVWSKEKE